METADCIKWLCCLTKPYMYEDIYEAFLVQKHDRNNMYLFLTEIIYYVVFLLYVSTFLSSVVNHDLLCLILLNKFINFPKSIFFSSPTAALIKLSKSASLVTSPLAFFTVFSTSHAFSNSPCSSFPDFSFSNASKSSGALLKRSIKLIEK